jgi:hypothetical protein
LTNIEIPDSVTSIEMYAFNYCDNLTNVKIPDGVTGIEMSTFNGCYKLKTVIIGSGVTYISDSAFGECERLSTVYYHGTESEWAEIEMGYANGIFKYATRYYYSESTPTTEGNFWHYDENGEPVLW